MENNSNNNIVKFSEWKRIFLNFYCKKPFHCLDKNTFTNNCFYCDKFSSKWNEEKLWIDDKDILFLPYYGDVDQDTLDNDTVNHADEERRRGWSSVALKMHPLVEQKKAYWVEGNILLTGYTFINDNHNYDLIFRPIFSRNREKLLSLVRSAIKKYVGQCEKGMDYIGNGFIRKIRQNIARRELLGIQSLNIDIIYLICQWL